MITPHGGKLVEREMTESQRMKRLEEIKEFHQININIEQTQELENIAQGVFSPLEGFLTPDEYESILAQSRLTNDIAWTIPIVLDISENDNYYGRFLMDSAIDSAQKAGKSQSL